MYGAYNKKLYLKLIKHIKAFFNENNQWYVIMYVNVQTFCHTVCVIMRGLSLGDS